VVCLRTVHYILLNKVVTLRFALELLITPPVTSVFLHVKCVRGDEPADIKGRHSHPGISLAVLSMSGDGGFCCLWLADCASNACNCKTYVLYTEFNLSKTGPVDYN